MPPDPATNHAPEGPPILQPQSVLHGHEDAVTALAFSPDGRWLTSAANDRSIRLWTLADAPARQPAAQPDTLHEFNLDSETGCLIARAGGELTVWAPQHGYVPRSLPGTERHFHAGFLAQGQGFVAVEMTTNGVPVHVEMRHLPEGDVVTRRELRLVPRELRSGSSGPAYFMTASPDGRWLAVSQTGADGVKSVYVFAIDTGKVLGRLPGWPRGLLWNLRASPDGRWLVRLEHHSGENRITIYDTQNWRVAHELAFRSAGNDVIGAAIDPASRFLATGGTGDNSLRVWDLHTGRLAGHCNGNVHGWHPVWSRDSRTLVVRDSGSLRLWSMVVFRELAGLPVDWHNTHLPLGFTAEDRSLVLHTLGGRVLTWSPPTLAEIDRLP